VEDPLKSIIASTLEENDSPSTGSYPPLFMIGRSERSTFHYIKDRVWQRISNCSKMLSQGREVLIKSMAQVIPPYCMSLFLFPESLRDEIEKMTNTFWWGSRNGANRGINFIRR
jgi:hypothetical protein